MLIVGRSVLSYVQTTENVAPGLILRPGLGVGIMVLETGTTITMKTTMK